MGVAVLTMVYEDDFFLERWIAYYSQFVSKRNLIILTHGRQERVWDIAEGCSILELERDNNNKQLDAHRWGTLTQFTRGLLFQYSHVICVDVDEFLVADPETGSNIIDLVSSMGKNKVWHPNGLEVVHRPSEEAAFDYDKGFLEQRKYFRTNKWYSKPCMVTDRSIEWKMDGHCSFKEVEFHPDVYLFHMKWFDHDYLMQRAKIRHDFMRDKEGEVFMQAGGYWSHTMAEWQTELDEISKMRIYGAPCDFEDYRRSIHESVSQHSKFGYYLYPRSTSRVLFEVPELFRSLL